mmetsp:Transcript_81174/g.178401  ORF Transcript_81174/g.178401 Transcript_81174/m.178401 type:complete len:724 (-) Transcript_81174:1474-3645(-)
MSLPPRTCRAGSLPPRQESTSTSVCPEVFQDLYLDAKFRAERLRRQEIWREEQEIRDGTRRRAVLARRLVSGRRRYHQTLSQSKGPSLEAAVATHVDREKETKRRTKEYREALANWDRKRRELEELAECTFTPALHTREGQREALEERRRLVQAERDRLRKQAPDTRKARSASPLRERLPSPSPSPSPVRSPSKTPSTTSTSAAAAAALAKVAASRAAARAGGGRATLAHAAESGRRGRDGLQSSSSAHRGKQLSATLPARSMALQDGGPLNSARSAYSAASTASVSRGNPSTPLVAASPPTAPAPVPVPVLASNCASSGNHAACFAPPERLVSVPVPASPLYIQPRLQSRERPASPIPDTPREVSPTARGKESLSRQQLLPHSPPAAQRNTSHVPWSTQSTTSGTPTRSNSRAIELAGAPSSWASESVGPSVDCPAIATPMPATMVGVQASASWAPQGLMTPTSSAPPGGAITPRVVVVSSMSPMHTPLTSATPTSMGPWVAGRPLELSRPTFATAAPATPRTAATAATVATTPRTTAAAAALTPRTATAAMAATSATHFPSSPPPPRSSSSSSSVSYNNSTNINSNSINNSNSNNHHRQSSSSVATVVVRAPSASPRWSPQSSTPLHPNSGTSLVSTPTRAPTTAAAGGGVAAGGVVAAAGVGGVAAGGAAATALYCPTSAASTSLPMAFPVAASCSSSASASASASSSGLPWNLLEPWSS